MLTQCSVDSHRTLHNLLPPLSLAAQNYSLRSRVHNRQLPEHFNYLDDSNLIIRMLYKNMYKPCSPNYLDAVFIITFYRSIVDSLNSLDRLVHVWLRFDN